MKYMQICACDNLRALQKDSSGPETYSDKEFPTRSLIHAKSFLVQTGIATWVCSYGFPLSFIPDFSIPELAQTVKGVADAADELWFSFAMLTSARAQTGKYG